MKIRFIKIPGNEFLTLRTWYLSINYCMGSSANNHSVARVKPMQFIVWRLDLSINNCSSLCKLLQHLVEQLVLPIYTTVPYAPLLALWHFDLVRLHTTIKYSDQISCIITLYTWLLCPASQPASISYRVL